MKPAQAAIPLIALDSLHVALAELYKNARSDQLAGMARFGIVGTGRLGVSIPDLRKLARQLGRNHDLALALWDTAIPDARILASMVAQPARLTSRQMDEWVKAFESWDVCDQTCLNAFAASPQAWKKVNAWATREDEFVRRASFALIACLSVHDKRSDDARFIGALTLIEAAAGDERNFVKKAVNWALRNIGKRNLHLHGVAIEAAKRIQQQGSKSARWIAADALRELNSDVVCRRLQTRQQQS